MDDVHKQEYQNSIEKYLSEPIRIYIVMHAKMEQTLMKVKLATKELKIYAGP